MGRKTRILTRIGKFGLKFANHPRIKDKKEVDVVLPSLVNDILLPINEEKEPIFEEAIEPEVETIIEEDKEAKKPVFLKKTLKSKK